MAVWLRPRRCSPVIAAAPPLAGQILLCPMLDDREVTVSSKFEGIVWDRTSNETGWTAMLGEARGGSDVSPYAAPARATDLRGLPPAYVEVGSVDVFRDEDIDYAARLLQAGVPTELHTWVGGFHGYDSSAPTAEIPTATLAAAEQLSPPRTSDPNDPRPAGVALTLTARANHPSSKGRCDALVRQTVATGSRDVGGMLSLSASH